MICPQCGYDMGTKHRCLRCGYEIKTLVTVDEEEQKRREKEAAKVIDPSNTYLTDEYGNSVDEEFDPFDPFDTLFGSLFGYDPFADLLGGLFGLNVGTPKRRKKEVYMDRIHDPNEDDGSPKIVEVNNVEVLDNEPKKKNRSDRSDDSSSGGKNKK